MNLKNNIMEKFEYIFMNENAFNEKGINYSKFIRLNEIERFRIVKNKIFTYMEERSESFPSVANPFEIKEIRIPEGFVMVVGYFE